MTGCPHLPYEAVSGAAGSTQARKRRNNASAHWLKIWSPPEFQ